MLFNSFDFIFVFLPIVFTVYFVLNRLKLVKISKFVLVIASLVFYAYWAVGYVILILLSIGFNYSLAYGLVHKDKVPIESERKTLFIIGVIANIAMLAQYKYFDFLVKNINLVLKTNFDIMHLALPLGISFFTFTQIAYLVDAYKGKVQKIDFINYALFVTYFPHLIAGPILHHKEMMPQFNKLKNKVFNVKNIAMGLTLFIIGLSKKICIADNLSQFVHNGFDVAHSLNFYEAWLTSFAYTFQLYFDFSGYTDMALAISMMFNIFLPINFNSPYKAVNIRDFWRRWHITLSRFLKDYIYIPFGGSRGSESRTYINLFLTFLIGGLWHGAGWTYIIWGALHGIALVIHRLWQKLKIQIPNALAIGLTFLSVNFFWVVFRAPNCDGALKIYKGMLGFNGIDLPQFSEGLIKLSEVNQINLFKIDNAIYVIALGFLSVYTFRNSTEFIKTFKPSHKLAIAVGLLCWVVIANFTKSTEFLYFQF